jgi:hypothetical protein
MLIRVKKNIAVRIMYDKSWSKSWLIINLLKKKFTFSSLKLNVHDSTKYESFYHIRKSMKLLLQSESITLRATRKYFLPVFVGVSKTVKFISLGTCKDQPGSSS